MSTLKAMLRIAFVFICIFPGNIFAQNNNRQAVNDVLDPSQAVYLKGYLADKLSDCLNNRILVQDADRLIEPFKPANRTENTWILRWKLYGNGKLPKGRN